jgi:starvation-inducible DNA-binding protein
MTPDLDMERKNRENVADGLKRMLADTYVLYTKTQNFHWNVTGPKFRSLHLLFEEQYKDLAGATDLIAERIRALDVIAPGTHGEFAKLTALKEQTAPLSALKMVEALMKDHETVAKTAKSVIELSQEAEDDVTEDMMTERRRVHHEAAWMLRSTLAKDAA